MPFEDQHGLSAGWVPEPDSPVPARRGETAVGAEREAPHIIDVPFQEALRRAVRGVPKSHRLVVGRGREDPAVRAEGNPVEAARMSTECHAGPPSREVPEDARFVAASRSEGLAVGAERKVVDRLGVASEDVLDDPGRGIPGLDRAVLSAREDGLAVGREDQPVDRVGVTR